MIIQTIKQICTRGVMVLCLSTPGMSGCISTNPVTPTQLFLLPPAVYEAQVLDGSQNRDAGPMVVEIQALRLPQYLEKPQIVTRQGENQLKLSEYDQWGGNLRKNMVRVMRENLGFLLATPHVAAAPFPSGGAYGYRITADVMTFEADASGRVRLKVHWQVANRASGRVVRAQMAEYLRPAGSMETDRIVAAMGLAMGDFCLALAQTIAAEEGE